MSITGFCGGSFSAIGNFFSAYRSSSQSLPVNTVLLYNTITNPSTCISYSTSTGIGTALVSGTYLVESRCSLSPYTSGNFSYYVQVPSYGSNQIYTAFINTVYVFNSQTTTSGSALIYLAAGQTFKVLTPGNFNTQTMIGSSTGSRLTCTLLQGSASVSPYGNLQGYLSSVSSIVGVYGCALGYSMSIGTQTVFLLSSNVVTSPFLSLNTGNGNITCQVTGWYYIAVNHQSNTYSSGNPIVFYVRLAGNQIAQGSSNHPGTGSGSNVLWFVRLFFYATAGQAITVNATASPSQTLTFLNQPSGGSNTSVVFMGRDYNDFSGLAGGNVCAILPLCEARNSSTFNYSATSSPASNLFIQYVATVGNAMTYTPATGIFEALCPGIYIFTWTLNIQITSIPPCQIQLFKNGALYIQGQTETVNSGFTTTTNLSFVDTATLLLVSGDQISLRIATTSNFTIQVNAQTLVQSFYLGGSY